jgi:basic membrane protein A and related proteins
VWTVVTYDIRRTGKEEGFGLRKRSWFVVLLMVLALFVAACAEDDADEGDTGGGGGDETPAETVDFKACQVTDTGGIDDKSFNETAYAGLERAESELGIEIAFLESQTPNDFTPNIEQFIAQECDLIITVGFLLGDATATAAEANPDTKFAIVDVDFFDTEKGEDITYDNVKELTFATDQAAFQAGYLAAGMTETGTLGTYGGIPIPPVTIFMNGFDAGMKYYNEQKGANVELLGWDSKKQDGLFTGDFENEDKGRNTTESLLDDGADIILPVAGPVGGGTIAAVEDRGEGSIIWVDIDGCLTLPDSCPLFLTSIEKHMDNAVFDTVQEALDGTFTGGLYSGTLENDGVGISEYHEFESKVPAELASEVEALRDGIISGEIKVAP